MAWLDCFQPLFYWLNSFLQWNQFTFYWLSSLKQSFESFTYGNAYKIERVSADKSSKFKCTIVENARHVNSAEFDTDLMAVQ
jgi:hypothetical protein